MTVRGRGPGRPRRQVLVTLLGLGAAGLGLGPAVAQDPEREIEIVARRFRYTPDELHARAGERIVLAFTALDFMHGFSAPEFGLRADLKPGEVTRVRLGPLAEGRYLFVCDNFCGEGHEDMNATLIVSP